MGKERVVLHVFFSTFYEGDAEKLVEEIAAAIGSRPRVERSRVVRELYHLEAEFGDPGEAVKALEAVRGVLARAPDTVYGVKAYVVPPVRGGSAG